MIGAALALDPELAALLPAKAQTFAFAARFLPSAQREATVVLYAFCRMMDDLVDEPPAGLGPGEVRARFDRWRAWLLADGGEGVQPEPATLAVALRTLIVEHQLPTTYLLSLLDGLESDLGVVRMPDFTALHRYCFLVAGTVGLAMCHVLGERRAEALAAAAELGIAMQLTNILRDLGSDLRDGRCYLPADELADFGYSAERLATLAVDGRPDDQFRALMRFQIARARDYYIRGLAGVWLLAPEVRPGILIAGRLYRAILNVVEAHDYDVLRRRAVTSRLSKVSEALVALVLARLPAGRLVADDRQPQPERLAELTAWLR